MRRKFKTIEFEFLRSFKGTKNKNELLELFNNNFEKITLNQLEPLLHRYKIPFKKLPSYTFKKGFTPWNKGKKTGVRPPNLFKKGIFADGNKENFDIKNLLLVSRKELAVLNKNKLIKNDAELTNIGVTIAKVKIAIAKKINKKQVKKND